MQQQQQHRQAQLKLKAEDSDLAKPKLASAMTFLISIVRDIPRRRSSKTEGGEGASGRRAWHTVKEEAY